MRRGLQQQFSSEPDFEVMGEAENGQQAIELAIQLDPDIVLMDIGMPVMDGIAAIQQIKAKFPEMPVLVLSAWFQENQVVNMLTAGANGYCLKSIGWHQLLAVIRLIRNGGTYLDPEVAQQLPSVLKSTADPIELPSLEVKIPSVLTDREQEVLLLISEGCSNQEIADRLFLSFGTIKSHVRMILSKLDVCDRAQAAARAIREGLI